MSTRWMSHGLGYIMQIKLGIFVALLVVMAVPGVLSLGTSSIGNLPTESEMSDFTHVVFCEEATATWCPYCPEMSEALYSVYQSGDYPFYFVAMVADVNDDAYYRLVTDYNLYGYPTSFFDGGAEVVLGGYASETPYREAIEDAGSRPVVGLDVSLSTQWVGDNMIAVNFSVTNNDAGSYEGRMRAYVVEPVSRWNDDNGNPYHFGFMGFAINETLSLGYGMTYTSEVVWDGASYGYSNLSQDNLMVIAVVFNGDVNQGYANPPSEYPFDAHYADQAIAAIPIPDTVPPTVELTKPQAGALYMFDRQLFPLPVQRAIIIGQVTVTANAADAISGVEKVTFSVDGTPVFTDDTSPYTWAWNVSSLLQQHTIQATAIDNVGNEATVATEATVFYLG